MANELYQDLPLGYVLLSLHQYVQIKDKGVDISAQSGLLLELS